jgi:hypothetical protein
VRAGWSIPKIKFDFALRRRYSAAGSALGDFAVQPSRVDARWLQLAGLLPGFFWQQTRTGSSVN